MALTLDDVEREYVKWERAIVGQQGGYLSPRWVDYPGRIGYSRMMCLGRDGTLAVEGDGSDLPDDYGIEPVDTERLVHTPWACGFTTATGEVVV